ncbi:hypothetical protein G6F55_002801 [Rhizopus delemar]|uniref:Glycosyl transferase 64 domain-containing protein n=2 Tax=Rhizopus TaxID=4842 RepID=A0A9P6Z7R5_9FUNG|nr:hypothetical protein G6F55_002801 [Rhizopus delemar]KAG1547898.1 hypothetical protein G6F51_003996 [Rhizopus arrhizus]KAG1502257.1 hypothetical protein G6F54_002476 [Rhizopus delemar]KAG1517177.1 hypothetical protein G6F53_001575 [Rhizopus delemar]KAG1528277.1 hypothetical protein G6F52_000780 [Rhizopus delemar]
MQDNNNKNAFVTFLCDDVMGEATEVLVYSLKQTNTQHDIVVLVLDEVTPIVRRRLEHLGAKIINVNQVKYPWESASARRKGFNKACRYSKLNLWNLTQYKKVVFLDADTMVVRSIDDLFDYPQFSAVVDIGGVMNTGVFVAEPNQETFKDIMNTYEDAPSYNKGDQGFLNYYFNQSTHPLPGYYNLMVKFTHFSTLAASFISQNTVRVLHFTSETKPWNFYFLHQREWRENYDGYLFGLWTRALRNMRIELEKADLWSEEESLIVKNQPTIIKNKGRAQAICDMTLKRSYGRRYPKVNQFTVIINVDPQTNREQLVDLLRIYSSSPKVLQIYIHGNTPGQRLSKNYLRRLQLKKPVQLVFDGAYDTPNTRYNPIQGITTEAVYMTDSSTSLSLEDLEFGFSVWRKNADSIVGYSSDTYDKRQDYSMIQSKAMFMKSDYLYAYTCLLPEQIHYYIDYHPTCHHIAINMLVSGMTGTSPLLLDAPSFNAIHSNSVEKMDCINDLSFMFNNNNPLVFNNQVISKLE